ncbi:DEKNAAC103239 [Brettanomyces naardenensis]|uniref:DEKNAAC103239 n=1 Tax=Brettanomyces naardenensis TaxID=13370 RepID=A0A448YMW9_BRENA|nr:DEKNAAC103239 [Brettanomyces naardenensis]
MPENFDWKLCDPHKFRPFKNKEYKINLGIRKLDPNDFICIENTYLDRTDLREKLFEKYPTRCHGFHPSVLPALREVYDLVFDFLVTRYPKYFYRTENGLVYNKIRRESIPSDSSKLEAEELERIICRNIEEDFLILLKNPDSDQPDEYILRAAVSCFPAGFNPAEKLNTPLTAIHGPVPGYKERLQLSMNRFFGRLKIHEYIVRSNWSIQIHANLCAPTGSHASSVQAKEIKPVEAETLDFNKVFFRVEKQCFTRLPKTKANLMLIRTYVTSMANLRDDVDIEALCGAIDGVKGDLAIYKRRIQWGDAVKSYLRGETNGMTDEIYDYKFIS